MDRIEPERRAPFAKSPTVGAGGAKTQRRIVDAGLEVFATEGFHTASIDTITQQAGCSRASFYQYFGSKDELFQAIARVVGADMIEMADRLGPVGPDEAGRAALHEWLTELVDHLVRYQAVISTYVATAQFNAETAGGAGSIARRISRVVGERIESSVDDPELLARILGTIVTRAPALWELWPTGLGEQRLVDGLADLVHRSIHGPREGVNIHDVDGPLPAAAGAVGAVDERRWLGEAPGEDREQMRTRLLDAARAVFPRLGYHGTRVDDIVAEAGVAHGTFYRYFADKNAIFAELALAASADAAWLLRAFPADGDAAGVRAWIGDWLDAYEPHLSILAVWMGAAATEPEVRELGMGAAAEIFPALASVVSGRGFGDPVVDAVAFIAMCERVAVNVAALGTLEREPSIDTMTSIIRRGFLGETT